VNEQSTFEKTQTQEAEMSDMRWATQLACSKTDEEAPLDEPTFLSSVGAPWLVEYDLSEARGAALKASLAGRAWTLWRYRELLPIRDFDSRVDLGEGGTPLVRLRKTTPSIELSIKEEGGNPSGSFKDRGLSMAVNRARELGAPGVELASAGNAGIALATFAAASGLPCRVAVPEDTPREVSRRCAALGAELLTSPGTLVDAGKLLSENPKGYWGLSTLREPYRVEGKKTMGLELAEQRGWKLPDWIIYPTGGGTGIIGMHKAFDELERLGLIGSHRPKFAVVQMTGCAPMVRAFEQRATSATPWENPKTEVWGLRVPQAIGDFLILRALYETEGTAIAVEEEALEPAIARIAKQEGILVGTEGAACLVATERLVADGTIEEGAEVVVFQTGHPSNYL